MGCEDARAPSRLVAEIRRQPALRFFGRQPLAARVVLQLLAVDLADREVARLRMGDVPTAHRGGRVHGVGLGEADAGAALDVEQAPELGLLGVIRARRVAGRRADAAILLAQQLLVGERLGGGVAPQLAPHPLVEVLGGGFRQAIGQRLEHDARVVVVLTREARQVLFDPQAGGDGERAEVVAHPAWPRRHVVGQTLVRLAVGLALLLAQEIEPRQQLIARLAAIDLHVVADGVGREQAHHGAHAQPALRDERLEHAARVGVQVAGRLTDHRIAQNVGESAGELPGVEERHPVDVAEQLAQRIVLEALHELLGYIDWMPFFNAWEFAGRFPDILSDAVVGEAASNLYADARRMLKTLIAERWLSVRAVVGLFAANSVGDDVEIYRSEARDELLTRLNFLRQQKGKPDGQPHECLADYVAPRPSGVRDYFGAFAVTAGLGIEEHLARFARAHDDYSSIMLKALADRLAEAAAEHFHERVRRELWGYAAAETLTNEQLVREEYRGIRPAPGYPACPDDAEKAKLWSLLDVERSAGIRLTESYAMYPTAAVSGWYIAHPQARYFAVGKIDREQLEDYARRKGLTPEEAQRWLAPSLGYEP